MFNFVYLERLVSAFALDSVNSGSIFIVFPELKIDQSNVKILPTYFCLVQSLEHESDSRFINNSRI